jgi:hypothetical protein
VAYDTNDILLGIRVKGGGIGWFKTNLSIFFNGKLLKNELINGITCDNDGNVLITGGSFSSGWFTRL